MKDVWVGVLTVLILIMICCQVTMIVLLVDKWDKVKTLGEIEEHTALMNNEAAALNLETERKRSEYYKALGVFEGD